MDDLRIKYIKAISEAKDENALEDVRLAALGKKVRSVCGCASLAR